MLAYRAQRRGRPDVLLPSLPTELLDQIFSLCKQSTLRDLNLTCKNFSGVARPRIFKTVIIRTISQLKDIVKTDNEILAMIFTLELAFDWDEEFQDEPWAETSLALVDVFPRLTNLQELILDDRVCQASEDPVVAPFYLRRPPFDPVSPRRRSSTSTPYAYLTLELLLAVFNHPGLKTLRHSQFAYSGLNLSSEAFDDFDGPPPIPTSLPFFSYPIHDFSTGASPPTLSLLLSLLSNFAIQPQQVTIPFNETNLEPARALMESSVPGLETVELDFDFEDTPGESVAFDLAEFFKALSSQHPSLKNLLLLKLNHRREGAVLRALAAIPGFEGFTNEGLPSLLASLGCEQFSVGFSSVGADGRREVLRLGSQESGFPPFVQSKDLTDLLEIFPTLDLFDGRDRKHLSTSSTLQPLFKVPSFNPNPTQPGLTTLLLPARIEPLVPDFEDIDLQPYCKHHSHLVPPLSLDDLQSRPAHLKDVVEAFDLAGGPANTWRERASCTVLYRLFLLAEDIPSLEVVVQDIDFGLGEVPRFVFDVVRDSDGANLVLREGTGLDWKSTPMDRGYACPCDLNKFYSGREQLGGRLAWSVEGWWDMTE